ncbi:BamA/TamA family outer membrane protein [Pedobacter sp. BS3]|uniref:translocation and assembly module lipoprotein TamL n=1 Tax=Pedobacter sp. BS3 TaxID=2567937 RepID=UPI0011ECF20C|nr:BamA/TamA family outer membrane protein [Pedobacter sp. BS3]TZF81356.1 BamA/TamA family outer membrane protein [Pedobacter sp. BS3]
MKAYLTPTYLTTASILLLLLILSGCSATRYLNDDQALVKKVNLVGINKEYEEKVYSYVQKDVRPNSRFNLALYNLVNTRHGKYRTDKIRKIGEAPNILDSSLVEISRVQIEKYLQTKGFFKAKVTSDIEVKDKKAYLTFTADKGPLFRVRNFTYVIPDSAVKKLYEANRQSFTHIRENKRYDADTLAYEREQIYQMMKDHGYYDYLRQYVRFSVDSNLNSSQADLKLFIDNPPGKEHHQVYTINNTYFMIHDTDGKNHRHSDSTVVDSQYHFVDYSTRFSSRKLSKYIFLKKGDLYNTTNESLTYNRLYELNVFKNLAITYNKSADSTLHELDPSIEATPLKRMSNRIEGEYTFNSGRSGFNIGDTYTNRNLFRGAEQLEIKFKYGILFDNLAGKAFSSVYNRDLELGAKLTFPRLIIPFFNLDMNRNGVPHTTISSSVQLFDQRSAFKNRIFINSISYDWVETQYKLHSLTPISLEYRNGSFDPAFRDSLQKQGYELYIRTNDRRYFSVGSQYTFTYNAIRLLTYDNFLYAKVNIDAAGNLIGLLSRGLGLKRDANGDRTIFGLPYLQYVKTELDLRYYLSLGGEKQLVMRLNPGVGYPYGNSEILPFEKNFYAGGSSGVRAWQARTLGPGNYNRSVIADEDTRRNLRGLDQLGEIKLEGNLEYRFKILNNLLGAKLKGATFTDFGNLWRVRETADNPGGEFKFNKFLGQLAIGAGAGLRFDLEYFVLRFDAGIKVKDPQFTGKDQYVLKYFFNSKEFKERYAQTNAPDRYNFIQYNFGIGMPF